MCQVICNTFMRICMHLMVEIFGSFACVNDLKVNIIIIDALNCQKRKTINLKFLFRFLSICVITEGFFARNFQRSTGETTNCGLKMKILW